MYEEFKSPTERLEPPVPPVGGGEDTPTEESVITPEAQVEPSMSEEMDTGEEKSVLDEAIVEMREARKVLDEIRENGREPVAERGIESS